MILKLEFGQKDAPVKLKPIKHSRGQLAVEKISIKMKSSTLNSDKEKKCS